MHWSCLGVMLALVTLPGIKERSRNVLSACVPFLVINFQIACVWFDFFMRVPYLRVMFALVSLLGIESS